MTRPPARGADSLSCVLAAGAPGTPFVIVPSVGSTPLSLVRLARAIAPARPVRSFAYAGLEDDAAPHPTVEAIARANVDELMADAPRGPWLVGGHCFGGAVAVAMALDLQSRGAEVRGVAVLDGFAPRGTDVAADEAISPAGRRAIEETRRRTLEHYPSLERDVFDRVSALLRLHIDASLSYRAAPLRVPLRVFRAAGSEDAMVAGWPRLATAGCAIEVVPGDTFSMLRPPEVEAVGRMLGRALAALA